MGLARQDRGAATRAGVGSPATSLQQRACPQPPCAKGVPGGAGPSAALTLLGDDPYHQSSRRLAADPAAPGMRPRDYRDRLLGKRSWSGIAKRDAHDALSWLSPANASV